MTLHSVPTVCVPAPPRGDFDVASRRARRRALEVLNAFQVIGEVHALRFVQDDGGSVPEDQITEQQSADLVRDLQHLRFRQLHRGKPLALAALLEQLYAASSHADRSQVGSALDQLLEYVDHWRMFSPERLDALFDRLEPSKLVRAVGQALLAATHISGYQSAARQSFCGRFTEALRDRGTPEPTIRRVVEGIAT